MSTNASGARNANAWIWLTTRLLLRYALQTLYEAEGVPLVPCHPRDLLNMALDRQRYLGGEGRLSPQELEWAWRSYFVQIDFLG